jgi:hypothetical protein
MTITPPLRWDGSHFPGQGGLPVKLSLEEYCDCCGWCGDEEHLEYPGTVNLATRFPYIESSTLLVPYPDGVISLGPFDVPMYIRHETDGFIIHDDQFVGGICERGQRLPAIFGTYYNREKLLLSVLIANPLPVGKIFLFTIVDTIHGMTGLVLHDATYARVTWKTS